MIIKITINQHQHFIEGDDFMITLTQGNNTIVLASNIKQKEYLKTMENLEGLRWRLEQLGNTVEVKNVFWKDPNFETEDEANKCLMEKGY